MTLLNDARQELSQRTRQQIEEATAYRWAARAVAAYERYAETEDVKWLRDCESYHSEAVEHGALADDAGAVLRAVRVWMNSQLGRDAVPYGGRR